MTHVFSKAWFRWHQRKLLWLCNSPVTRDWFRHLLRIDRDHPVEQPIVEIAPQHIILANGGNEFTLDTRCAPKFANRLYHGLLPLWQTMHGWDNLIANRYRPAWNLGFDTLTVYPDVSNTGRSCDSDLWKGNVMNWATIRSGNATNSNGVTGTSLYCGLSLTSSPNYQWMFRTFTSFLTEDLTTSAVISAATYSLYGNGAAGGDVNAVNPTFNVASASPSNPANVATTDYDNIGGTAFSSAIARNSWSTAGYNDFALNASGIANIVKDGVSCFSFLLSQDITNTDPGWYNAGGGAEAIAAFASDEAGTSKDPKLVVTYTIPSTFISQVIIC